MTKFDAYHNGKKLEKGDFIIKAGAIHCFDHVTDDNKIVTVDIEGLHPLAHTPADVGVSLRRPAGTIDLTPTWRGMLRYLIVGLVDGNATGQSIAREELERMADLADAYNTKVAAPLDWRPVSEYQNADVGKIATQLDDQPQVMLWHERTGPVIGKLLRWHDGDMLFGASGYHGYQFTHFATFNTPSK